MRDFLESLNIKQANSGVYSKSIRKGGGAVLESRSPGTGEKIAAVSMATAEEYDAAVNEAYETFREWRNVPAPERGQVVREIGNALRDYKKPLGQLVSLEMGKILQEGEGEVQEAIDIADFAVGLSRQLYGRSMHSERPGHRMYEQWQPLGVVGVISAFNFPVAVWAWNAMIAAVCGDTILWKPSKQVPLSALAANNIARKVAEKHGFPGLFSLVIGSGKVIGQRMLEDKRLPLISATGSCRMGRVVAETVGKRLGKTILELGGNNAIIVSDKADIDLAIPACVFGAVGTAGQRCTSLRRIFLHKKIAEDFTKRLIHAYGQVKIGDPLAEGTLMGPLANSDAVEAYKNALEAIGEQGGEVLYGGEVLSDMPSELYVKPTIVKARADMPMVQEETFAPIVYLLEYENLDAAIGEHNCVPQGLSSAIFTTDLRESEKFLSASGSDCGIANVNIGTSGAEIGGAFGGEKDTGGGRESGSDSWKQYMRRQTVTINYSSDLPLAQGIEFKI